MVEATPGERICRQPIFGLKNLSVFYMAEEAPLCDRKTGSVKKATQVGLKCK
jgi:hypothetical protein